MEMGISMPPQKKSPALNAGLNDRVTPVGQSFAQRSFAFRMTSDIG